MLLKHPWLKDVKVSHDWKIDNVTIHGMGTLRTIHVTKRHGGQTKKPKVLICYDFHSRILNEKDVMFVIE
jgi:hypothetical protein